MVQDLSIPLLHLLEGMGGIEGSDWDITAINLYKPVSYEHGGTETHVLQFPVLHRMDQRPRRYYSCGLFSRAQTQHESHEVRSGHRVDRTWKCHRGNREGQCLVAVQILAWDNHKGTRYEIHALLNDAERQRCHSRWAKVTGCEKGRSTSRSGYISFDIDTGSGILPSIGWL